MTNIFKSMLIFLIFSCSLFSGCLGGVDEIEVSSDQNNRKDIFPDDISPDDGVPACADSSSNEQPCPSSLQMRKISGSNGYSDWIAFDSNNLEAGEINQYDMVFDDKEFTFSRWSLSVSSYELKNPHIFLDWISTDGTITPIGGSTFDETFSKPSSETSEYKDERWLGVEDDDGRKIRTFQMLISFTEGVTLRAKVLDSDGSSGEYQMAITIYTNRKPIAQASLLSPPKVSQNSTIYVDGCKTNDPDFLGRQNDNPYGKLTWMLDTTDESNGTQRIGGWGTADCFLSYSLKGKQLDFGKHTIYLLSRDYATSFSDDADSYASVEFEIVPDEEYSEPELIGVAHLETELSGKFAIDSVSPMQFIDLPFTRSDFSIGVGIRYEMELESTGNINFEHIIDLENNTFDINNASTALNSNGNFRPWILVKYSVWDKNDRNWKDGEVEIPMLSCASIYDDMPYFDIEKLSNKCPKIYYWDKAMEINQFKDGSFGNFDIDQTIDIAALNLFFILDKFAATFPPLSSLLKLLDTIGDVEIPLSFGMNINANGLMTTKLDVISNGFGIDGQNSINIELFGEDNITQSHHQLTGDNGFIAIQGKSETLVEISMVPTIGIGITYKFFGKTIFDYDYRWELSDNLAKKSVANIYSTNCENILWEI